MAITMHRCPKCQSTDLRVEVTLPATLVQYNGEITAAINHGQPANWSHSSPMLCNACDYTAQARHFDTAERHLDGEELRQRYDFEAFNHEHPRHPRHCWALEADMRNTVRGYWDWCAAQNEEFARADKH